MNYVQLRNKNIMWLLHFPVKSDNGRRTGWIDDSLLSVYSHMLNVYLGNSPIECRSGVVYLLNPTNIAEVIRDLKFDSKVSFKHPSDNKRNTLNLEDRVNQWAHTMSNSELLRVFEYIKLNHPLKEFITLLNISNAHHVCVKFSLGTPGTVTVIDPMHGSLLTELLLQMGQYFNILQDFLYLTLPTYNIGIKPVFAGFPSNPINPEENIRLSSPTKETRFHVITEDEFKKRSMPYQAPTDSSNCGIYSLLYETHESLQGKYTASFDSEKFRHKLFFSLVFSEYILWQKQMTLVMTLP